MIDQETEAIIAYSEGHKIPGVIQPTRQSIWQWVERGQKSKTTGRIVYLESIQIGGRNYTSVEAFKRFIKELNREPECSTSQA